MLNTKITNSDSIPIEPLASIQLTNTFWAQNIKIYHKNIKNATLPNHLPANKH